MMGTRIPLNYKKLLLLHLRRVSNELQLLVGDGTEAGFAKDQERLGGAQLGHNLARIKYWAQEIVLGKHGNIVEPMDISSDDTNQGKRALHKIAMEMLAADPEGHMSTLSEMFSSNPALPLAVYPELIQAFKEAADRATRGKVAGPDFYPGLFHHAQRAIDSLERQYTQAKNKAAERSLSLLM